MDDVAVVEEQAVVVVLVVIHVGAGWVVYHITSSPRPIIPLTVGDHKTGINVSGVKEKKSKAVCLVNPVS